MKIPVLEFRTVKIKPLSVNGAWQGKRFKTPAYKAFETELLYKLPKIAIPEKPYEIHYIFGFSNKNRDLLNPEKLVTDIICKKYSINDRYIERMILEKEIVKKGDEFIEFKINTKTNQVY